MNGGRVPRRPVLVAVLGMALTACTGRSGQTASGPTYDSVEQLGQSSDVILLGSFTSLRKVIDDAGYPGHASMEMLIGDLVVTRSNKSVPGIVQVAFPTRASAETEGLTEIKVGSVYLLFGERVGRGDRGGLQEFGDLYNIVGYGDGIFEVSGLEARPLGPGFTQGGQAVYSVDTLMHTTTRP